jgi:hypothetical protein
MSIGCMASRPDQEVAAIVECFEVKQAEIEKKAKKEEVLRRQKALSELISILWSGEIITLAAEVFIVEDEREPTRNFVFSSTLADIERFERILADIEERRSDKHRRSESPDRERQVREVREAASEIITKYVHFRLWKNTDLSPVVAGKHMMIGISIRFRL